MIAQPCDKVCESRYLLSSHVVSLMAVENDLYSVVGEEVNVCGSEKLTGLLRTFWIIAAILRVISDCVVDVA